MNKKVLLSWLILVALIATSAGSSAAASGLSEQSGQFAAEAQRGVLADSDDSDDRDDDDRDDDDRDDDDDPDNPPTPTPTNIPEGPLPPVAKPDISNPADLSDQPLSTVLGFTFPSGVTGESTIPLEATAFLDIQPPASDGFTQVGIVAVNVSPSPSSPGIEGPFIARNDNDDNGDDNDTGEDDNGNGDDDEDNGNDDDTGEDDDDDGVPTPTPTPDPGALDSATYLVEIDVVSTTDIVQGRLFSFTTEEIIDVNFRRIPQIVNPQLEEAIYPEFQLDVAPTNIATIASNSVCFVVNAAGNGFVRYCSTTETSPQLSVRDSFPVQYTELKSMIMEAADRIGYTAPLALGKTLSTIEDGQRIQDCANATACISDIIVAPVTRDYFEQKYNQKFGGGDGDNGGDGDDGEDRDHESQTVSRATASSAGDDDSENRDNDDRDDDDRDDDDRDDDDRDDEDAKPNQSPTPIDIAVMRILQPTEFPTDDPLITVLVQPGDYRLDVWFDVNGVFFAATLTCLTTDDSPVVNQQIPAIPELFIDVGGNSPDAEISGFCIFGWCTSRTRSR